MLVYGSRRIYQGNSKGPLKESQKIHVLYDLVFT